MSHQMCTSDRLAVLGIVLTALDRSGLSAAWVLSEGYGHDVKVQRGGLERFTFEETASLMAELGATETERRALDGDNAFTSVRSTFPYYGETINVTIFAEPTAVKQPAEVTA